MSSSAAGEAVVIGASVAGILAAKALTGSFRSVSLVDRDVLPAKPVVRRGSPQARHSHLLLVRGRLAMEELFPGLTDDLVARGGLLVDKHDQSFVVAEGARLLPAPSDLRVVAVSRPVLETYLRERVAALPGVRIVERCEAIGLVATADNATVTGVRVKDIDGVDQRVLPADLVVDASGRSNRSMAWLSDLGYDPPVEDEVRAGVVYATREYRRTADDGDLALMMIAATPSSPKGAGCIAAEGDRWVCTLFGMREHAPPEGNDGFEAFAATLASPAVHDMLRRSEPLGDVVRMRLPASTRRRYERLRRFPDGYVAIGDAVCNLNATYGQGMTVAALEALALRACLRRGRDGLPRRYFRAVARIVDVPWQLSTAGDLRFPWVEGERTAMAGVLGRYVARLHVAARGDAYLTYRFLRVVNMVSHPGRLFGPDVVVRVLRSRRT